MKYFFLNNISYYFQDGQNNNGYVPYVDYSRDYNPPPPPPAPTSTTTVDPRYSAAYGNPYLRNVGSPNLPPPTGPPLAPPPPPYSAVRNGNANTNNSSRLPLPSSPTSQPQYITTQQATIKRGTLATHV